MTEETESREMYLKAIYQMQLGNERLKSRDLAKRLGYSPTAVSKMMRKLVKEEYILPDYHAGIRFTEEGEKRARRLYDRYVVFSKGLKMLGVDEVRASATACRMEHVIPDDVYEVLKSHIATAEGIINGRRGDN